MHETAIAREAGANPAKMMIDVLYTLRTFSAIISSYVLYLTFQGANPRGGA